MYIHVRILKVVWFKPPKAQELKSHHVHPHTHQQRHALKLQYCHPPPHTLTKLLPAKHTHHCQTNTNRNNHVTYNLKHRTPMLHPPPPRLSMFLSSVSSYTNPTITTTSSCVPFSCVPFSCVGYPPCDRTSNLANNQNMPVIAHLHIFPMTRR